MPDGGLGEVAYRLKRYVESDTISDNDVYGGKLSQVSLNDGRERYQYGNSAKVSECRL